MRIWTTLACALALLLAAAPAGAKPAARSWAAPQIQAVVDAGLLASTTAAFRPNDPLTAGELATVLASLGAPEIAAADPYRPVTIGELDAQLVSLVGLRESARDLRLTAVGAGLAPRPWFGTEAVARLLELRINHPREQESLELQVRQPATRAEAAYSLARLLRLSDTEIEAVRATVATFYVPALTPWQQQIVRRSLRFVGSPYVWAGTSERPQQLFGKLLPGGFDCSGFVWRVYKTEPYAGGGGVGATLRGRTSYDMSGEVPRSARIPRDALEPGDVVFFGSRGPRSKPSEVGHMGIYLGNGWIVHSSGYGTTVQPLTGWYETRFAWGRRPLAEAGLE
jgi:cell wall-associated NlpC family hydrolase